MKEEEEKKNPLLVILVTINTLVVLFLVYTQMNLGTLQNSIIDETKTTGQGPLSLPPHHDKKVRDGHVIEDLVFPEMDANFETKSGPRRFLKFSFILAVETPQDNPLEEIKNMKPTLIDDLYSLINKTTSKSVLRREGKESFKASLIKQINKSLKKDKVIKVYYTKFIVK